MTYREKEKQKAIKLRDDIFKDSGNGLFSGKEREFVLNSPTLNLWEGIREDAIEYFKRNGITWWNGNIEEPTGHLLSSQIACINHLYFIRQRQDLATSLLRRIDPQVKIAEIVDDGFVEFEFIGMKQYLAEKSFTRGAHCTSVDAAMIGLKNSGAKCLFLIEWKYTENYSTENKYIEERAKVYDHLIKEPTSPFREINPEAFYFEPFYQLMRQTLLGWLLSENGDHGCTQYRHIHVVPEENEEFNKGITSEYLFGDNVSEVWRSVLTRPELYIATTPEKFLSPLISGKDTKSVMAYLGKRYW